MNSWRTSVIVLRIAAPLMLVACLLVGSWAWAHGNYALVAINAFLAGVNLVLTWIEWWVFELH